MSKCIAECKHFIRARADREILGTHAWAEPDSVMSDRTRLLEGAGHVLDDVLGRPIAQGKTAEIYAWKTGKILKLFRKGWPISVAENEACVSRQARFAGLHVPASGSIVEIDGRVGLVYDLQTEPSLLRAVGFHPWSVIGAARLLAEMQSLIHSFVIPDLPSQRQRMRDKIQQAEPLSNAQRQTLLKALEKLPDGNQLCHGDFHPDNILVGASGPIIVDWADAGSGNPWADVAHTSILLRFAELPTGTIHSALIELGRHAFHWFYLQRYSQLRKQERWQFKAWLPVAAAARLPDASPVEQASLLAFLKADRLFR